MPTITMTSRAAQADYMIMRTLYDAFLGERQLGELGRGAFERNLRLATGSIAVEASPKPQSQ